jgi:hypothetical protein
MKKKGILAFAGKPLNYWNLLVGAVGIEHDPLFLSPAI